MKSYCVIGHPISHSASPRLHQAGFREYDIDAEFTAIDVTPDQLEEWVKREFRPNFQGAAVTIPHKETIRKFLDQETAAAKKIGAVNTLFWEGKKLTGTNTDCLGALRAMQNEINPHGKKVLLLGAGGACRAILFALKSAKSLITIWNRTAEKAKALADEFHVSFSPSLEEVRPENFDLIVNTTSVGLNEWKSVLPENFWQKHHTAFDTVYSPLETKFLSDAAQTGARTITGDLMLVHQAVEQFRIWHGEDLDPEIMETAFFEG